MACAWLQLLTSLLPKVESAIVSVNEQGLSSFTRIATYTEEVWFNMILWGF
jgi:hypothetical protein